MKTVILFGILFGNSLWFLISETLLLGYAQTLGILVLGIFTVIWTNRIKKKVADLKTDNEVLKIQNKDLDIKAVQLDTKIDNYHAEVDGKVTALLKLKDEESRAKQELAKVTGEAKGAQDNQNKTDAEAIKKEQSVEPTKVVVVEPAEVVIVKKNKE